MPFPRQTLIALLGLLATGAPLAHADHGCKLSINASNISIAWNLNFNFQSVVFTLSKADHRACDYQVAITRGGAPDYARRMTAGANALRYQLYKDSSLTQILQDYPEAQSSAHLFAGSFPQGKNLSQSLTFYVQIPPETAASPVIKPSGSYQDTFAIRAYSLDSNGQPGQPEAAASITIATQVPKIIDLSLLNPGGSFDSASTAYSVNFGTLAGPQSKTFDLRIRTNAGYRLQFSSQNGGALKKGSDSIPYRLTIDTALQDLSHPGATVATGGGQTSPGGVARAVSITTSDATERLAGQYSDYITVTASTTE